MVRILYDEDQYTLKASWPSTVTSDALITKQKLLKTEQSPVDYLLSYANYLDCILQKILIVKQLEYILEIISLRI